MARVSGLQKSVWRLYKRSLRLVASKPVENRSNWFQFMSHQFRSQEAGGGVKRRDTATIEYLIRRHTKMLEQYENPGVKNIGLPGDEYWPEGWVAKGGKHVEDRFCFNKRKC